MLRVQKPRVFLMRSESESKKTPFSIEKFQMAEAAAAAVSNTLGKVAHSSKCVFKAGVSAAP